MALFVPNHSSIYVNVIEASKRLLAEMRCKHWKGTGMVRMSKVFAANFGVFFEMSQVC